MLDVRNIYSFDLTHIITCVAVPQKLGNCEDCEGYDKYTTTTTATSNVCTYDISLVNLTNVSGSSQGLGVNEVSC